MIKRNKELLLYIFFGGCATVVSIGSFVLCYRVLAVNELIANVISWVLAVSFAYATNRTWVFCSHARGRELVKEACAFFSGRVATLVLEEGILLVFATWLAFPATAVKIAGQIVVLVGNYLISKLFVFREK